MGESKAFLMKFTVVSSAKSPRERVARLWPRLTLAAFGAASSIRSLLRGAAARHRVTAAAGWTLLWIASGAMAQTGAPAPAVLPGKGLAQHDFFYAGESKEERMSIVRGGHVVWSYTHAGRGEISDAVLQPNGNILFAHQYGVTEITLDKKVVWNFDAPAQTEIHTAQPIGAGSVWFIQNGNPAKFIVMNKGTGKIEHQFELPVKNPASVHGQFRQARLTAAGTILVAHMDMGKVVEYDLDGKSLWSQDTPGCWSAAPLKNGNILVAGAGQKYVREINRKGETVWEWKATDTPEYKFSNVQTATRLPNGNTIVNNWFNQWSDKLDPNDGPVQAIEVTPDKKVVWALRAWAPPADLGPSTTIQILDDVYGPAVLPGKGLKQHAFLYTGEWDYRNQVQTVYVVRDGKVLLVDGENRNLELGSRNLEGVKLVPTRSVTVYDLLAYQQVLLSETAARKLSESLAGGQSAKVHDADDAAAKKSKAKRVVAKAKAVKNTGAKDAAAKKAESKDATAKAAKKATPKASTKPLKPKKASPKKKAEA